jgi:predicted nucleic acid-binding protein
MMVADTDVLMDFLEDRPPAAARIALELARGDPRTTVITRFKLLAGAMTARQRRVVGELIAGMPCLPLDDAGRTWLPRSGKPSRARGRGLVWRIA